MILFKNIGNRIFDFFKSSRLFLFLPVFLLLSYFPNISDPFILPRAIFLSGFVLVYSLFLTKEKYFQLNFYSLIFLVLSILSFTSTLWASNISESISSAVFFLFISILFIFFQSILIEKKYQDALIKGLLFSSFLILIFVLVQLLFNEKIDYKNVESFVFMSSPLGHKNITSGGLLLLLPFTINSFFSFNKVYKILATISILSSIVLIAILQTRSVYLALFIMFSIFFLGMFFFLFSVKSKSFKKKSLISLGIILLLFILLLIYNPFNLSFIEVIQNRIRSIFSLNQTFSDSNKTIHERLFLWKGTFNMIKEHFLLGVGAGNWKLLFPFEGLIYSRAEQGQTIFQRPHNDFLWVFSEVGILGFLLYISIFIKAIYALLKDFFNKQILNTEKIQILILLSGIMAFVIFTNFSFPIERVFLVFILAIYLSLTLNKNSFKINIPKNAFLVINIFIIVVFVLSFNSFRNIYKVKQYANLKHWHEVIKYAEKANSVVNKLSYTSTPIHYYKGVGFSNLDKNKEAQQIFLQALKYNPTHLQTINALAKTYEKEGELEQAFKVYDEALSISPLFYESIINISSVSFQLHNYERCFHYLARLKSTQKILDERYFYNLDLILVAIVNDLYKNNSINQNAHNLYKNDTNFLKKTFFNSGPEYKKYIDLLVAKAMEIN